MKRSFFINVQSRWALIAVLALGCPPAALADEAIQFNRDVRPILSDACYHCHGPDKARRKADLRLDLEETARAVIGKPEHSKLLQRITSDDPDKRMPPAHSGRQLSKQQIDTLRRWIEQGAAWQKHWAFIAPVRPEPPQVKNQEWIRNPIDRFILARLERENMSPSPEASPNTLIRRLSFDLTGLPPTPAEVDAFVREYAATPQAAYEKLVDHLLASPRYGERMAWRWLEAARYADTNGYQTDAARDMYRWRDWVIEAYNRNLPFDRFTVEQIAGDMLPNATLDQKIATGFNRNHRGNSEGGIVPEEYAVEYVADRVETTSTVWLGLTLGCARCHDHKYDPFAQKEFYQLFAYFNNVPEKGRAVKYGNSPPYIKAPTREQVKARDVLADKLRTAADEVAQLKDAIRLAQSDWESKQNEPAAYDWAPEYKQLHHWRFDGEARENQLPVFHDGEPALKPGKIGKAAEFNGQRYLDAGNVAAFGFDDKFSFSFWVYPRRPDGAILSRMAEEPEADGYGVYLKKGKLLVHLTNRWLDDAVRVESEADLVLDRWHHVVVAYDGSRAAAGVKIHINGREAAVKTLLDELYQNFKTTEPLRIGSGGGKTSRFDGLIDEFRVYSRKLTADDARQLSVAETVAEILHTPPERRSAEQQAKLHNCFLDRHAPVDIRAAVKKLRQLEEKIEQVNESFPTAMVMQEMPTPRDAFVLLRGEYDKPGEKVSPRVPAALSPLPPSESNNRLGFANWLVDPANPLTARVAVNRMWQLHFGMGLVKTGEDFGTQGDFPVHPELLDWLATEFVRLEWDIKKMHKTIVMSATYRQSSKMRNAECGMRNENPKPKSDDPENRLLSRGPRQRLSAEMVRDQALFAGGLLVEKLGGPSVKPYQPAGLWKELSGADYKQDKGENLYRRSLYTFWKRTSAPPSLMTFDASTRETCVVRETRTNTPLQALTLLNDVTYVEAARLLAQRVMKAEETTDKRIELAYKLVVSRSPSPAELDILKKSFDHHLAEYREHPNAAVKLLRIGDTKPDPKLDVATLAACAQIASLILNLDEAVTKE